ncbi:MAG: hypothetical protein ACR2H4_14090 [Pyrinomonadaceae bacterium]
MKQLSKPEVLVVTGASAELGRAITRELARGAFGERASASFTQQWANKNRRWLSIAGAELAGVTLGVLLKTDGKQ